MEDFKYRFEGFLASMVEKGICMEEMKKRKHLKSLLVIKYFLHTVIFNVRTIAPTL